MIVFQTTYNFSNILNIIHIFKTILSVTWQIQAKGWEMKRQEKEKVNGRERERNSWLINKNANHEQKAV